MTYKVYGDLFIKVIDNEPYKDFHKTVYYDDIHITLSRIFKLDKNEIDGYLFHWIFQINPDFNWVRYQMTKNPYIINTMKMDVATDAIDAMVHTMFYIQNEFDQPRIVNIERC